MSPHRGRFAPSPTGSLHFGSLVAAMASYLDARQQQGEWLVRIDDIDTIREQQGAADKILLTLDKFGFEWHGDILRQSSRLDRYQQVLDELKEQQLVYRCSCSRKEIADIANNSIEGSIYPGTCRSKTSSNARQHAWRIITNDETIAFEDRIHGNVLQHVYSEVGDFVLKRADGLFAYQLAVVVDDEDQQVSSIVRGSDLLFSTPRQIYLQQKLGFQTPEYAHIPLVKNNDGRKLSKSDLAFPVDIRLPLVTLGKALEFLGQAKIEADTIDTFWQQAINNWSIKQTPK